MNLSKAIDIIKTEKEAVESYLSNGNGNIHDKEFVEAVDVITEFVDRCVALLMR